MDDITVWTVAIAALITAIATGLGALPFFFFKRMPRKWLGLSNALAAGLMIGASLSLIWEGIGIGLVRTLTGAGVGFVLIWLVHEWLEKRTADVSVGDLEGADAIKALMIMGIMTAHSLAEGVGVGVSFGEGQALGNLITLAIAVHNIPEGLAISLVLVPRGTPPWRAGFWSIVSSLPQPLMAVPAFLFVLAFWPFLPAGLGFAAGAMVWMVFNELLPDALEDAQPVPVGVAMVCSVGAMLIFQALIG